jgi:hypothetical protein
VQVSQARRSEWAGTSEPAAKVIEGAMDDQIRRSGPERASGQQPGTERYQDPATGERLKTPEGSRTWPGLFGN